MQLTYHLRFDRIMQIPQTVYQWLISRDQRPQTDERRHSNHSSQLEHSPLRTPLTTTGKEVILFSQAMSSHFNVGSMA